MEPEAHEFVAGPPPAVPVRAPRACPSDRLPLGEGATRSGGQQLEPRASPSNTSILFALRPFATRSGAPSTSRSMTTASARAQTTAAGPLRHGGRCQGKVIPLAPVMVREE